MMYLQYSKTKNEINKTPYIITNYIISQLNGISNHHYSKLLYLPEK